MGLLPEGYIYQKEEPWVRDLLRKRLQLVRQRTRNILSIESLLARHTGARLSANAIKGLKKETIGKLGLAAPVQVALRANWSVLQALEAQIKELERAVQGQVKGREEFQALKSAPWIRPSNG